MVGSQYYIYRKVVAFAEEYGNFKSLTATFFVYMNLPWLFLFFWRNSQNLFPEWTIWAVIFPFAVWTTGSLILLPFLLLNDWALLIKDGILKIIRRGSASLSLHSSERKFSPINSVSRRNFIKKLSFGVASSPFISSTYGALHQSKKYDVTNVEVELENLPDALNGLKIAHVTDFHSGIFVDKENLDEVVAITNGLEADIVALTGDFVSHSTRYIPPCEEALSRLRSKYGIYGCLGNHDHWVDPEEIAASLERSGVRILRNEAEVLDVKGNRINIIGVDNRTRRVDDEMDIALRRASHEDPKILLCHKPWYFPYAVQRGIDLTLSGHVHGGQVVLEFLGLKWCPAMLVTEYIEGLYRKGKSHLYLSRGVGVTGTPVRLNCPPEIALIRLV